MAWLQKRPQVSDPIQFYSSGLNKSKLIVGLGNPGKEYLGTRHNVGFACLDAFVDQYEEMSSWVMKKDLKCEFSSGRIGDSQIIAMKPTTFMNNSGDAVQAVLGFYKLDPKNVVIVHDELDIDFGQIRLRVGGSSAGHNGLKSIINRIGEDFGRIRIGIGPKKPARMDSADFVLQPFPQDQLLQMKNLQKEVNAILSEYIYGDVLPADTRLFLI